MKIISHETEPPIELHGLTHLEQLINNAVKQAKDKKILSIILLNADNDNELGIVVGGNETVLSFTAGDQNPPYYYASKSEQEVDEPIMTCFLLFQHHTEFSRRHVIPFNKGLLAVHEFYETVKLPTCIEWIEV